MIVKQLTSLVVLVGTASLAFAQGPLGTLLPQAYAQESVIDPVNRFSLLQVGQTTQSGAPNRSAAARIKIDEEQERVRRAAVKYLATVDCHYYPEAETCLIGALRADHSESVRFEAALALSQSRSLSPRMLEALNLSALGLDLDGNPAETSERVRAAACQAILQTTAQVWAQMPFEAFRADPMPLQQTSYFQQTYPYVDPMLSVTPERERGLVETINKQNRCAAPTKTRSIYDFVAAFFSGRENASRDPQSTIAARMQGIRPITSQAVLAIPGRAPVYASPFTSTFPYNVQD
jgi:hypothetical protein